MASSQLNLFDFYKKLVWIYRAICRVVSPTITVQETQNEKDNIPRFLVGGCRRVRNAHKRPNDSDRTIFQRRVGRYLPSSEQTRELGNPRSDDVLGAQVGRLVEVRLQDVGRPNRIWVDYQQGRRQNRSQCGVHRLRPHRCHNRQTSRVPIELRHTDSGRGMTGTKVQSPHSLWFEAQPDRDGARVRAAPGSEAGGRV